MTHIASYPSKKAFKEACKAGLDPYLDDPSMFDPVSGRVSQIMQKRNMITVTNHPKRSWFACIKANGDGSYKVE